MMALKARVETLDDVPEGARDFYEESDEGYRLTVEGVVPESDFKEVKTALSAANKEAAERRHKLEEIPDDWQERLAEWKELKEAEKERERRKAEEKGEYEKLRKQLQDRIDEKDQEWQEKYGNVVSQLEQKIVDEAIVAAASEHDAWAHLLPDYAKRFVQVKEVDGKRVPVVVDEDGDRRVNEKGDPMSISELVAWMKEEERYQPLFKPSGASGGGAGAGSGAGGPGQQKSIKEMSDQEKQDFIDENGIEAFREKLRSAYAA